LGRTRRKLARFEDVKAVEILLFEMERGVMSPDWAPRRPPR